jgi:signal recognition particle GTPase
MKTPTVSADEVLSTLTGLGEYELTRQKTKYEKRKSDIETKLATLQAKESTLRSDAYEFLEMPDELAIAKLKVQAVQNELNEALIEKDVNKVVLSKIDKMVDEIAAKKNHEQILKYLKSQGYTTVEQVKEALSKNH